MTTCTIFMFGSVLPTFSEMFSEKIACKKNQPAERRRQFKNAFFSLESDGAPSSGNSQMVLHFV